jgi:hypothetical protein
VGLIKGIAARLGYDVQRRRPVPPPLVPGAPPSGEHLGYDLEEEAVGCIEIVRKHTMLTYPRLVTLYQQAVHCEARSLPGSYVECGSWRGGAVGMMALANLKHGKRRRPIHVFDSFEGIPEPDAALDGAKAVEQVRSVGGEARGRLAAVSGFYEKFADGVGDLESNRHLLESIIGYDPSCLHYHKGWFQDTLPQVAPGMGEIAILRLDGDWYASTAVCLEHLHDHVVPGGFVIIDDYGCYEGCRRAVDEFRNERGITAFLHHIDGEGRYWIRS